MKENRQKSGVQTTQSEEPTPVEVQRQIVTILWDWFGRFKAKPVTAAYLHKATMLPGGLTESSLNNVKTPGLKMFWLRGEGLALEFKGITAIVPSANVAIAHLDGPKEN